MDVRLFCKFLITCLWLSIDREQEDEATDGAPNQSKLQVWPLVKILKSIAFYLYNFLGTLLLFIKSIAQQDAIIGLEKHVSILCKLCCYPYIFSKFKVHLCKKANLLFIGDVQMDFYILTFFPHTLAR